MRLFGGERIASVMQRLKVPEGEPIQSPLVTKAVENAQKKVEANNFSIRKRLLEYDNVMNQQREVIYDRRRHALMGERLKSEIMEYVREMAEGWYDDYREEVDVTALKNAVRASLLCEVEITENDLRRGSKDEVVDRIVAAAADFYDRKEQSLGSEFMAALERVAALQSVDDAWREHLRSMDDLKEGIYLRAYGQKDPLLEYKQEAYKIFVELVKDIDKATVQFAYKYYPRVQQAPQPPRQQAAPTETAAAPAQTSSAPAPAPTLRSTSTRPLTFSHPSASSSFGGGEEQSRTSTATIANQGREIGRNEPCPCGSGKKFKSCHGAGGETRYTG